MPAAEDLTERDFITKTAEDFRDRITLKEFVLGIVDERERKYEQRFQAIDKSLADLSIAVKDSIESANTVTKDALSAAYANIAASNASVDKRFDTVNEFRAQLADQQETFARKSDVDGAMAAFEKATLKAEAATEKRFEQVNEFRAQLYEQQATFVRKSETDIRFEALEKKLDTAVSQLQVNKGRESGISAAGGVIAIIVSLLVSVAGVVIALVVRHT